MPSIYLDYAATTPMRPEVVEAMTPYFYETFGNPSSSHQFGLLAQRSLHESRERVAACIGVQPGEIIFTSGGTESDNLAIKAAALANRKRDGHVITCAIEHPAVLNSCRALADDGFDVTILPVDSTGLVDLDALEDALRPETVVVSIMLANNETGVVQPLADIAALAHAHGALVHTDAVQAVGKMPVDVHDLGVDMLTLSGHKLYGPKGVGALYAREGTHLVPLIHGGSHEGAKRAGTENLAAIVGLAMAFRLIEAERPVVAPRMAALRDRLHDGLCARLDSVHLNGHRSARLPHVLNVGFEGVPGPAIHTRLDARNIAVSAGSACKSASPKPSHVLTAMGVPDAVASASVRFSLGRDTTAEEIDTVIEAVTEIVSELRQNRACA